MRMARALKGISVLIVEDDVETLELLALGLAAVGANVKKAGSAEDGMGLLESWRPDVILCDIQLPGIDGYTFLELLRANPRLRSIPAAALSGVLGIPREHVPRASFEKLLSKPSKLPEIVLALATLANAANAETAQPDTTTELREVLQRLNTASGCRFTSLLIFGENDAVRSLWTYDRDRPKLDPFPLGLPVHASYCVLVREAGEMCVVEDARTDPRTTEHPERDQLTRYIGVPLFGPDGKIIGTVCSYDAEPRPVAQKTRDAVAAVARDIEPWVLALLGH